MLRFRWCRTDWDTDPLLTADPECPACRSNGFTDAGPCPDCPTGALLAAIHGPGPLHPDSRPPRFDPGTPLAPGPTHATNTTDHPEPLTGPHPNYHGCPP